MICARQTCFWGELRAETIASSRALSEAVIPIVIPVRIQHCRTKYHRRESQTGLFRHNQSTSCLQQISFKLRPIYLQYIATSKQVYGKLQHILPVMLSGVLKSLGEKIVDCSRLFTKFRRNGTLAHSRRPHGLNLGRRVHHLCLFWMYL